jgi:UDP-N-acetylmuramoyl-tripeptide--D-alanyl-D-alanine ligase
MNWTLPGILRATGGELLQWGAGPFTGISTDSRQTSRNQVFLALSGERFDAHEFLPKVVAQGATGVIVSRPVAPAARGVAWMRVAGGLRALGDLAAARRRELRARVVGVTGSNGKTTTKEMIAAVLGASGKKVARTAGTENNLVGLPKAILGLDGDEDYVVLEMGMNRPGEIWRLAEIADPDVGVITNVGPAHLEGLGSLANVAAAKGELALAMSAHSTLVVNGRDRLLVPIAGAFPGRKLLVGLDAPVVLRGAEPEGASAQRLSLTLGGRAVTARLALAGEHNAWNATLAAAVGFVLGLDAATIAAGLERFVPPPMRLERLTLASGAIVVNDAYNANPASMAAALAVLVGEPATRRIAVLGAMRELGAESDRWHREVGAVAAAQAVDLLVAVGVEGEAIADGARAAGLDAARIVRCADTAIAAAALHEILAGGDVVLVKGSRGAGMEDVIARLRGEA